MPLTPHQLRHTFARQVTEAGMPITSLSKLLGHAQITTTQIYTAGADPELAQAYQQTMAHLAPAAAPPTGALPTSAAAGSTIAAVCRRRPSRIGTPGRPPAPERAPGQSGFRAAPPAQLETPTPRTGRCTCWRAAPLLGLAVEPTPWHQLAEVHLRDLQGYRSNA